MILPEAAFCPCRPPFALQDFSAFVDFPMSLPNKKNTLFGAALLGACLPAVASVPAAAFLASVMGDDYDTRVLIYGGLLLWSVVGAISIFILTKDAEGKPMTLGQTVLWFVSAWLWPLLVIAHAVSSSRRNR